MCRICVWDFGLACLDNPHRLEKLCLPKRPQKRPNRGWYGSKGLFPYPPGKNRTQAHTVPSLVLSLFLPALLLWQSCQISFQLVIHRLLDRTDCVKKIPIAHQACLGFYFCGFRVDQSLFFQLSYVLCNRVGTHPGMLADPSDAGPALMRFPVLAEHQVGIDGQFARGKTQREDFVWQKKIMAQ